MKFHSILISSFSRKTVSEIAYSLRNHTTLGPPKSLFLRIFLELVNINIYIKLFGLNKLTLKIYEKCLFS